MPVKYVHHCQLLINWHKDDNIQVHNIDKFRDVHNNFVREKRRMNKTKQNSYKRLKQMRL